MVITNGTKPFAIFVESNLIPNQASANYLDASRTPQPVFEKNAEKLPLLEDRIGDGLLFEMVQLSLHSRDEYYLFTEVHSLNKKVFIFYYLKVIM